VNRGIRSGTRDSNPSEIRSPTTHDPPEKQGDSHASATSKPSTEPPVSGEKRRPEPDTVSADLVALAAAVEALSSGHARVLAAKLRAELERLAGPGAVVVSIDAGRRRA